MDDAPSISSDDANLISLPIPEWAAELRQPARYKVFFGGRGGAKSHSVAKLLLLLGTEKKIRILCLREFQSSMRDSVHKLLSDQIELMGIQHKYEIQQNIIIGTNGTEITFEGLRHNTNKIRSQEGTDIVWVEEAQTVSKLSWDILIPTIRKDDSEIWITFNPELDTDETYKRFVLNPPKGTIVRKINWNQNPWFPNVLKDEMEHLKNQDYDAYLNVWEGHCKQALEGAIYAKEIREATVAGRICRVPYSVSKPVDVFFDLGWSDNTSLWFVQRIGFEMRVIRSYQNRHQALHHYLHYIQSQQYIIGTLWLPHDARAKQLGTGLSIEEMARASGYQVKIVPSLSVEDGINAVRTVFPSMYFDEENCADGIQSLRRYRYKVDQLTGQTSREPMHDEASHYCLTGDTLVSTKRGDIAIKDIVAGDEVITPHGYSHVENSGPVKIASKLIELEFSNGSKIKCTPEHKFFTKRGLVIADSLRYSDIIINIGDSLCNQILSYSKAKNIGFRDATIVVTNGRQKTVVLTCIEQFGRIIMEKFRMAMTSITLMEIHSTMLLRILNASYDHIIVGNISSKLLPRGNCILQVLSPYKGPLNGMDPKKGSNGIAEMGGNVLKNGNGIWQYVKNVVENIKHRIRRDQNSVIRIVSKVHLEGAEATQLVYDLTVEKHHCYLANGILVSNSDSMRYVCVALHEPKRPKIRLVHDIHNHASLAEGTSWMG